MTLELTLPEETLEQSREAAATLGISLEAFVLLSVAEHLARVSEPPDIAFEKAMDHVLEKNAELYKRLA